MLTTSEMRWFFPGEIPKEIENWFATNILSGDSQTPEDREDWYLRIPGCETLGVKLRQQRLEIKWRSTESGIWHLKDHVAGAAEKWVKWTCEEKEIESVITKDVIAKGEWVRVKKVRSQIRYLVNDDRTFTPAATDLTSKDGCNIELTQLKINQDLWWSLSFEASGQNANLENNLEIVTKWAINTYPQLKLPPENSYAYPKWFAVFVS